MPIRNHLAAGTLQFETQTDDHSSKATRGSVLNGAFVWRIGALTHELPNGDIAGRGQSLEIWKRVRGEWKLHRQMSSSVLA